MKMNLRRGVKDVEEDREGDESTNSKSAFDIIVKVYF